MTVVVGAGIIGLSLAFELQERGLEVTLIADRDHAGTATHTAAGMLAPVSEADVEDPRLVPFALDSLQRYPALIERVEATSGMTCGYRDEGLLWVALHRDHRAELEHLQHFMAARGFELELLGSRALRRLEPALTPRAVGGARVAGDHQVDPRVLRAALKQAVTARGAQWLQGRVVGIETDDQALSGLQIEHSDGAGARLPCSRAVLATGAWLGQGLAGLDQNWSLRPVKGQVVRLAGKPLLEHVVRTPDVYLVPRHDGRLVIGASAEEAGFDTRPMAGPVLDLLRHAVAAVPEIQELELEEVSVGLRPATADHLPVVGASSIPGLHVAGGHYRNGILLAAATAWHLAAQIADDTPAEALSAFNPKRFQQDSR